MIEIETICGSLAGAKHSLDTGDDNDNVEKVRAMR